MAAFITLSHLRFKKLVMRHYVLARLMCADALQCNREGHAKLLADESGALQPTSTPSVPLAVIHLNQHCF